MGFHQPREKELDDIHDASGLRSEILVLTNLLLKFLATYCFNLIYCSGFYLESV